MKRLSHIFCKTFGFFDHTLWSDGKTKLVECLSCGHRWITKIKPKVLEDPSREFAYDFREKRWVCEKCLKPPLECFCWRKESE